MAENICNAWHEYLEYTIYLQFDIVNTDTNAIIEEILSEVGGVGGFPGDVFLMSDDTGKALLGTPNGNGQAWLLATHKAQFGAKTIESVRVFGVGEELEQTVMAFKVIGV